jgi:hypothetical protein
MHRLVHKAHKATNHKMQGGLIRNRLYLRPQAAFTSAFSQSINAQYGVVTLINEEVVRELSYYSNIQWLAASKLLKGYQP